jgi:hypothetical protein
VQGFSGVTVADITGPAKVTRATFYYYYYYYFTDKTQLFVELGTATYIDVPGVVESFSELHGPADRAALMHWIDRYFAYLDRNGAFVARSSEDAPDDARFRAASERSYRRTATGAGRSDRQVGGNPARGRLARNRIDGNGDARTFVARGAGRRLRSAHRAGDEERHLRAPVPLAERMSGGVGDYDAVCPVRRYIRHRSAWEEPRQDPLR